MILTVKSVKQLISVIGKSCFLSGTDGILKYYLDELRLQRVNVI
jgi:hypothetical protein